MTHEQVPTYEGRPLPRPDEELVDQGLAFDLATLVSRRQALRAFGLGAAAVGLVACGDDGASSSTASATPTTAQSSAAAATSASPSASATTAGLAEIPDETAGPYPGDGSNGPDVLNQSGVVRRDIRSSFGSASGTAPGVPLTIELSLKDLAKGGSAFAGAAVYLWHCDREGRYSLYSDGVTDQNYLRGVQVAGTDGKVTFTSIFPACYSGRWPHIHFEVYPDQASITDTSTLLSTSQLALPQDACQAVYAQAGYSASVGNLASVSLQSDNVFGDDGGAIQLPDVTGSVTGGYRAALVVGIDTTTTPTAGQPPGGGGAPGGTSPEGPRYSR
jgi:protocatechuate 3,4-dioxygenase beta subunit